MNSRLSVSFVLIATIAFSMVPLRARAESLDPSAWRGDARVLVAAVDSIHPQPHRWFRRAAWDSAAADLERRLPTLSYGQAVGGFAQLLGMLRDGHSRLDQLELPNHGRPVLAPLPGAGFDVEYPIEFEIFANGLWVVTTTAAYSHLLGTHVLAIGGTPVAKAVVAFAPMISAENPMWILNTLPAYLRSPGYVDAAGLARDPGAPLRLTLVDARGRRREASVRPTRPDSAARWITADANVRSPLPLTRDLHGPFAFADMKDSARTVFARIRAIVNDPGEGTFAKFVQRLFAHVDSLGSRRLILDLRGNGGGNNYLNQPLVHAVIMRPELNRVGRLFVIVDRGTFSAAVDLAAELQRETHAIFVGEPTGGAPNSFGDPAHVKLPGSGIVVRISTLYWQGSDPRDPRAFIAPDLPVLPTWADWMGHRDPALTAIEAYRPSGTPVDNPPNTRWSSRSQLEAEVPRIAW